MSAAVTLDLEDMSGVRGGCYGQCQQWGFCNARPYNALNDTPCKACWGSAAHYTCSGPLSPNYCVTRWEPETCGEEVTGKIRDNKCIPYDGSTKTGSDCNKAYCDTTP